MKQEKKYDKLQKITFFTKKRSETMAKKEKAVDTTEVMSIRISKKAKYLLDLASKASGMTIGKYVEHAIMSVISEINIMNDGRRNLKTAAADYWDGNEVQRKIFLLTHPVYELDDDDKKVLLVIDNIAYRGNLMFYNPSKPKDERYNMALIEDCWKKINELAECIELDYDINIKDNVDERDYSNKFYKMRENLINQYIASKNK